MKGYASNLHDASQRFAQSMKGSRLSSNLDTRDIPLATSGTKGKLYGVLSVPTRLLEASDQFFTALTEGGEKAALTYRQSKGVNVPNLEAEAANRATYRLFRSELKDPRQGVLLDAIDSVTSKIQQARTSNNKLESTIAKFTLPFVRTPMNILKQTIEYSPAGVATLPGASNKTEQLSKAIFGSSMALGASLLATSGRTTWAEPTDEKKRAAFRAAGMQPYSVKIGDKWVSYSKLPPVLAANLALISAINDARENETINDNEVDNILSGVAKWGNFFADQSYVKQIGDLISAAKGDVEGITRYISNYPQQLVPFRAMMGWITRIVDPYQRKVDKNGSFLQKQIQQLEMSIPGLSTNVPARLDTEGNPIENQNRFVNSVSPMKITVEKQPQKMKYLELKQKSVDTKNENITRDKVESDGKPQQYKDKLFYKDGEEVKSVSTNKELPELKKTGLTEIDKKSASDRAAAVSRRINDLQELAKMGQLSEDEANQQIIELLKERAKLQSYTTGKNYKAQDLSSFLKSERRSQINSEIDQLFADFKNKKISQDEANAKIATLKKEYQSLLKGKKKGGTSISVAKLGTKASGIRFKKPKTYKAKAIKIPSIKTKKSKLSKTFSKKGKSFTLKTASYSL